MWMAMTLVKAKYRVQWIVCSGIAPNKAWRRAPGTWLGVFIVHYTVHKME